MNFSRKRRLVKLRRISRWVKKTWRRIRFWTLLILGFAVLSYLIYLGATGQNKTIVPRKDPKFVATGFGTQQDPKEQSEWLRLNFGVKVSPQQLADQAK